MARLSVRVLVPSLLLCGVGLWYFFSLRAVPHAKLIRETLFDSNNDLVFFSGCQVPVANDAPRHNAALVMLARNSDVDGVIRSIDSLEQHFNQWFNYPWVLLNDEPFTEEFKQRVSPHTANISYHLIPQEHWQFPDTVNNEEMMEAFNQQADRGILYGAFKSYHQMCRYYSYNFYKHPAVAELEWYWRVEPDVEFFCDITYDPFEEMAKHKKKYGFNVLMQDLFYTLPGLYRTVASYMKQEDIRVRDQRLWHMFMFDDTRLHLSLGKWDPHDFSGNVNEVRRQMKQKLLHRRLVEASSKDWAKFQPLLNQVAQQAGTHHRKLYPDRFNGYDYNWGHFWTNFEIARVDVFTSDKYRKYYDYIDKLGGFWRERWGDAPVRLLALAMLLTVDEIHYFRDIGYRHLDMSHCPINDDGSGHPAHIGCNCKCSWRHQDLEERESYMYKRWKRATQDGYSVPLLVNLDDMERELQSRIEKDLNRGAHLFELIDQ